MRFGIDLSGLMTLRGLPPQSVDLDFLSVMGIRSHGLVWLSVLTRAFLMTSW
jgi:hypothetical protein